MGGESEVVIITKAIYEEYLNLKRKVPELENSISELNKICKLQREELDSLKERVEDLEMKLQQEREFRWDLAKDVERLSGRDPRVAYLLYYTQIDQILKRQQDLSMPYDNLAMVLRNSKGEPISRSTKSQLKLKLSERYIVMDTKKGIIVRLRPEVVGLRC